MTNETTVEVDVVIVGSGFGGLAMAIEIERRRLASYVILEQSDRLGGTWRDNTYPGAACDVPGSLYRFSFAPTGWSRRFPPHDEILAYMQRVAEKTHVASHVRYSHAVTNVDWDQSRSRWHVRTNNGTFAAKFVVMATGQLSRPGEIPVAGATAFRGPSFHTARWRHDVDLTGKRVGVVGTGASAIQVVPAIAGTCEKVTVFQRSAPYVIEKKDPVHSLLTRALERIGPLTWPSRFRTYLLGELLGSGIDGNEKLRAKVMEQWQKFRDAEIPEGDLRERTTPDYVMGCKRVLFSSDWYRTLRRDDVELVTHEVTGVSERGVYAGGVEHELDVIIWATGFETNSFLGDISVTGINTTLAEYWGDRPRAHRGVSVSSFPNFFMLYGPNTNLGSNSIILMLEAQSRYVAALIRATVDERVDALMVRPEALGAFVAAVDERSARTAYVKDCHSWYTAGGVNTNNWPDSVHAYRKLMRDVDLPNYEVVGSRAQIPL